MHLSTMPTSEVWRRSPDASATTRLTRAVPSAALALGLLVVILADSSLLLSDPDSLWHVATGRWVWAHREVPTVDAFSHTVAGTPWIAKEWLSQLLLFAAHASAGWWGVVVLTAASIGAAIVVLHEWLRARLRPTMALLLAVVAIFLGLPHFLARPHVLVLPIIALWMSAVIGAADRGRAPPLAAALLMVVWTNMHGSFPLGLGLAALMAAETIVFAPVDARPAAWRGWASFLALAGVAALLSPYGWHAVVVPLTVGKVETIQFIDEWKRIELDPFGVVAIGLLVTAVVLLARDPKREAFRMIAVGILGLMMIRHVRFISTFGLLVPFLVARVSAARWSFGRPAAQMDPTVVRLHPIVLATLAALLAAVVALVATMRPAPIAQIVPDRAVAFAQAHDLTGRVYNTYDFGGFLIDKGIPTFVDGRTDQLFLGDFLPKLRASIEARGNEAFSAMLAAHHVTWALVRPRSAEARKLESLPGWSRLYADDIAAVYGHAPPTP